MRISNRLYFYALILCSVFFICDFQPADASSRVVVVGLYDNKPMSFMSKEGPGGIYIDVLEGIAKEEGWELHYQFGTWNDVFHRLTRKELDILPVVAFNESRLSQLDFCNQTLISNWGQVYARRNLPMESIENLEGKKIATLSHDTHGDYFKTLLNQLGISYEPILIENYMDIFRALDSRKCDVGVVNYIAAKSYSKNFDIQPTPIVFNPIQIRYAVPKGDPADLLTAVDKHISTFKSDRNSIYYSSMAQWFEMESSSPHKFQAWMKWGLISISGIIAILFAGNIILRIQVRAKTKALSIELNNRKTVEKEIQKSEARYRQLVEQSPCISYHYSPKDGATFWSSSIKNVLGFSPEEVTQKPFLWTSAIHPDDIGYVTEAMEKTYLNENYDLEYRIKDNENNWHWFHDRSIGRVVDGDSVVVKGLAIDITDRKKMEDELREKKERFRGIVDSMSDWVWEVDSEGRYTYCSEKIKSILGYSPEEMIGKKPFDFMPTDEAEKIKKIFDHVVTAKGILKDLENWNIRKDGKPVCFLTNGVPIINDDDLIGYRGVDSDITVRKQADEELRKSEEKFRSAFHTSPDAINLNRMEDGTYLEINDGFTKIMGYSREDAIGESSIKLNIWKDKRDRDRLLSGLKEYGIVENLEAEFIAKDGSTKLGLMSARILKIEDETVILSITRDITDKKQLETDREQLLAAIEQAAEGIIITDVDGTIKYANPSFGKITGYSAQEVIGQNPGILKSGEHDALFYQDMWNVINSGHTWKGRIINKRKDGNLYSEEATISPVFDKAGKIINFVEIKRDITDELKMEERLQQSQKMEAIGTLAGGIAHDFNNILFPIVGHTEMLLEDFPEDSPLRDSLNEIYTGSLRARDLVQQILAFSRQKANELKLMKMQPIIKEALKLIRATIPTTISIHQNLQSDCGAVEADPTQIHQVVMNLTTNAYHAMDGYGGELRVTLTEIELGEHDLMNPDMEPGLYACLTVSDTGKGMDKKVLNKIFEPFFTTKKEGKGTGMGLSVVHGIVKSMNGAIQVYSEPDKGTQFHVYIPVIKNSYARQETQTNSSIQGGTESVLLVDDEKSIIAMEKQILERLGYQVTALTSGMEALEAFKAGPDNFDLVITDMAMPKMSGDRLAVELIKIRKDIPVVICTGFSEAMTEEKAVSLGVKGFILKPVIIRDLAIKIRQVLNQKNDI